MAPTGETELDIRELSRALWRRAWIAVLLAILAAVGTYLLLGRVQPLYTADASILIEERESPLTRPRGNAAEPRTEFDESAIQSQVEVIRSREIADAVVDRLNLARRPEFDPAQQPSMVTSLLVMLGLEEHPASDSVRQRVMERYFDRLSVYPVGRSRVIGISFEASNPDDAAEVANSVATNFVELQQQAQRESALAATAWLEQEIDRLRGRVAEAEQAISEFRRNNGLFDTGASGTLSEQQLNDINAELARARAARAEAEARAALIESLLVEGGSVEASEEVLNSQLIQRLRERQVALQSQIADLSTTLLPGHPRIRALQGQLDNLDMQILQEAERVLVSLQTAARVAAAREDSLQQNLDTAIVEASRSNVDEIELRALEREATAQRDLLESFLGRYREAIARTDADYLPADARIISSAVPPRSPSYPKKAMISVVAAIAAFLIVLAILVLREFMSGRAFRVIGYSSPSGQAYPFGPREEDAVPVAIAVTAVPTAELRPSLAAREAPRHFAPPPPVVTDVLEDIEDEGEVPTAASNAFVGGGREPDLERSSRDAEADRYPDIDPEPVAQATEPEPVEDEETDRLPENVQPDEWRSAENEVAPARVEAEWRPADDWRYAEVSPSEETDMRLGPEADIPPWPETEREALTSAGAEGAEVGVEEPLLEAKDIEAGSGEPEAVVAAVAVDAEETAEAIAAEDEPESAPQPMAVADPPSDLPVEATQAPTAIEEAVVPGDAAAVEPPAPELAAPTADAETEAPQPGPYAPPERDPPGTAELATIVSGGAVRVVLFAGAEGGEGAGEIAYATARHVARAKQRCVVVDIGARRSAALAGLGEPGLSELLAGEFSFGEVIRRDEESRVHVIPLGKAEKIPAFERLQLVVGALTHTYDKVIVVADSLADWPDQHMRPDLAAIVCGPRTTELLRTEVYEAALERGARSAVIVRFSGDNDGIEASEAA